MGVYRYYTHNKGRCVLENAYKSESKHRAKKKKTTNNNNKKKRNARVVKKTNLRNVQKAADEEEKKKKTPRTAEEGKKQGYAKRNFKEEKKKTHTHTRIYRERGERKLRTTKQKKSICGKRTAKILRRDFFSEANRNTRHTLFIRIEEKKKGKQSH